MTSQGDDDASAPALLGHRLRLSVLFLFLLAVPAATILGFEYARERWLAPPYGAQPGGTLLGTTVGPDGAPAAGVAVVLHAIERNGEPLIHARTESDASGGFRFDAPAIEDGYYGVAAGGGEWQLMAQNATLRGAQAEFVLELEPGCLVEFVLPPVDGRPVRGGSFVLRSRPSGILALGAPRRVRGGEFDADRFEVGGLPPGDWTLEVELTDGPAFEYSLALEPGRRELELPAF